ncbi:MAG: Crp/Fnr family transcriptional regulator [Flavobacteriaceae bacterium]|nr:Crp/Fnr family transcriptional regulator [Flavobacteriaceae bacterium]
MSDCNQCIVRELNSLKKLSKEELRSVSEHKSSIVFDKGDIIFEEGNSLQGLYCIDNGIVKLSKLSENGKEQIVRFLKRGDMLGYRSVLNEDITSLKATAMDNVRACFIPKDDIGNNMEHNHSFSKSMFNILCTDLKNANQHSVDLAQKSARQRLAEALLFLDNKFGRNNENYLNINLSREEFSSIIGVATESTIRLLSSFKKEKLIELKGKNIKILDIQTLENINNGF